MSRANQDHIKAYTTEQYLDTYFQIMSQFRFMTSFFTQWLKRLYDHKEKSPKSEKPNSETDFKSGWATVSWIVLLLHFQFSFACGMLVAYFFSGWHAWSILLMSLSTLYAPFFLFLLFQRHIAVHGMLEAHFFSFEHWFVPFFHCCTQLCMAYLKYTSFQFFFCFIMPNWVSNRVNRDLFASNPRFKIRLTNKLILFDGHRQVVTIINLVKVFCHVML